MQNVFWKHYLNFCEFIAKYWTIKANKLLIYILIHLTSGRRACRRARPPDSGWAHSQRCPLCRWLTRLPAWMVDPGCVWSHSKTRSTRPARDQDGGGKTPDAIKIGHSELKPTDELWCLAIDEAQITFREKQYTPSHAFLALWRQPVELATSVWFSQECRWQRYVWSHWAQGPGWWSHWQKHGGTGQSDGKHMVKKSKKRNKEL